MEANCHQKYLESMSNGVEGLWLKQQYTDVTIKVGAKAYKCHRVLLSALSSRFKELLLTDEPVVEVDGTDSEIFEAVLQYMYTGSSDLVKENTQQCLTAAVKFQIPCLQELCELLLQNRLTPETCIGIWRLAKTLVCVSLTKSALGYILELFPSVLQVREFADLEVDELIAIISDNDLNTPSEEVVCDAVMNWVAGQPGDRWCNLTKLFGYIRFPQTSSAYVTSLLQNGLVQTSDDSCRILNDVLSFFNTGSETTTVDPRQFHFRTEETICVVGTRSRQPNPEATEIKCFSFNRKGEYILAPLPEEPGARYAVCSMSNNVFLSGGYLGHRKLMKFVSAENRWQTCSDLIEGRWGHSMEPLDGNIYLVGGIKNNKLLIKLLVTINTIEMYNPTLDTSEIVSYLAIPVSFMATAVLGSKLYIFGGKMECRNLCQKIQCFDATTKTCDVVGDMPLVSSSAIRVAVVNNTVYIFYAQGEIVEFREGSQATVTATMPQFDHFGVLRHGDVILIEGVSNNQSTTLVFDPQTRKLAPFGRTMNMALCNFWCMNIVMSKHVIQAATK